MVAIVGLVAYAILRDLGKNPFGSGASNISSTTPPNAITTADLEPVSISVSDLVPVPNLNRPVNFPSGTNSQIQTETSKKINDLITSLKENPNFPTGWLQLGLYRKANEDYVGAKEAWEYAAYLDPKSSVYYGNLGNLYSIYLNEPAKAETNYLKAIELDPTLDYLYFQAANFYVEVMKDTAKAKILIQKGIERNPYDHNLKDFLESL